MKYLMIVALSLAPCMLKAQDTVKCYVQLMVPADGALGIGRNIENNALFMSGGMFIYTKAFCVKDSTGKYVKFLNPRRKELKDIWWPESGPVVMRKDW